jgi:hypothetical protein
MEILDYEMKNSLKIILSAKQYHTKEETQMEVRKNLKVKRKPGNNMLAE